MFKFKREAQLVFLQLKRTTTYVGVKCTADKTTDIHMFHYTFLHHHHNYLRKSWCSDIQYMEVSSSCSISWPAICILIIIRGCQVYGWGRGVTKVQGRQEKGEDLRLNNATNNSLFCVFLLFLSSMALHLRKWLLINRIDEKGRNMSARGYARTFESAGGIKCSRIPRKMRTNEC